MKRKYITIPFGKKEKRVRIVLCRKTMAKGLAGLIQGKCLPHDLAILIDNTSPEKTEYLHAALVGSGDMVFAVQLTPTVFHGIRQGDAMARVCLFHELGHFVCKHLEEPGFQTERYDAERYRLASEGKVIRQELEADAFAAKYLGCNVVADGLGEIRHMHEKSVDFGVYAPEEIAIAMQELDNRIGAHREKT